VERVRQALNFRLQSLLRTCIKSDEKEAAGKAGDLQLAHRILPADIFPLFRAKKEQL